MIGEIIMPGRVNFQLKAATKEEVIKELLNCYRLENTDSVFKEILHRETLMTTGLGKSFAVLRGFTGELPEPAGALGISKGIDFNSLDHLPVKIFLFLLFPSDFVAYPNYISAALSLLNQETVRSRIPEFHTAESLIKFIKEKEV